VVKELEILVFKNFLNKKECNKYIKKVPKVSKGTSSWDKRTSDITKDPIVEKVTKFLKKQTGLDLKIEEAQTQNWNVGSKSRLHIHYRRPDNCYTSSLYLNDDFEGGEFFTVDEIMKPSAGTLTFFNGQKIWHGVKEVFKKDRKTIIFWWGINK
jgi:phenylpyruvate tautomerase PptA (4-oxalocrotonate tautomerase family)